MDINITSREDLENFLAEEVVNTYAATQLMGFSRQYIHKLVTQEKLIPIKIMHQDKLFLKSDILALRK